MECEGDEARVAMSTRSGPGVTASSGSTCEWNDLLSEDASGLTGLSPDITTAPNFQPFLDSRAEISSPAPAPATAPRSSGGASSLVKAPTPRGCTTLPTSGPGCATVPKCGSTLAGTSRHGPPKVGESLKRFA